MMFSWSESFTAAGEVAHEPAAAEREESFAPSLSQFFECNQIYYQR